MHKRNASATTDIRQIILDEIFILISYLVSSHIYFLIQGNNLIMPHLWMYTMLAIVFVLAMYLQRMYFMTTFYYVDRIVLRSFYSTAISAFCISMVIFMLKLDMTSRLMFAIFCTLTYFFIVCERLSVRKLLSDGKLKSNKRVLFIGLNETFEKVSAFQKKTTLMHEYVNNFNFSDERLKSIDELEKYIIENQINRVIMEYNGKTDFDYEQYLRVCEDMGVTSKLLIDLVDLPYSQNYISSIGTFPVITYHSVSLNRTQLFIKKSLDFLLALIFIVLTSPIYIIVAIAIKLDSPGPVFFKQTRVGAYGELFTIYKFRSMYIDAEQRKQELLSQNEVKSNHMFKIKNDPRITKVGSFIRKTSIDEFPQMFNVLKGDMSLVGTRPPTMDEVEHYERHHRKRISIKPGITGMWQVSGRSEVLDFEEVVKLDNSYIENWSLSLDFKLLLKTAYVVLCRKGAE